MKGYFECTPTNFLLQQLILLWHASDERGLRVSPLAPTSGAPSLARNIPLALGAHRPVSVHSGMYQGAFAKKSGPRTPRPPGGRPALGFFVRNAEGLPSTRNWPFRWPLPLTSRPPQVIPKAI
jgi:hypothetical protein